VVIVIPAHRAPVRAIALFLEKIAQAASAKPELVVLLIGRRDGAGFAPVEDAEFGYWRTFKAIHRLRHELARWTPLPMSTTTPAAP
jgi:hypothetical protein